MHISFIFIAGLLLAHTQGALGGSRYWEAKAPNKRTNPTPDYPAIDTLNATSSLFKRAASIVNRPGDNEVPRIWPNKKIRYCFQDRNPNAVVRGLWDQAMELWAPLKWHGFSYEEVSNEVCQSQRSTVLRIHYNANGRLYSTLGIPVIDEEWNRNNPERAVWGPHTHLSDMEGIGQDDIAANVAHELGHIWGLFHEHQISSYWRLSTEHMADPWGLPLTSEAKSRFQTNGFNCRSLSDYDTAHAKVREKIDAAREKNDITLQSKLETDLARLCISREAAQEHGFSAGDWLPKIYEFDMEKDAEFDPQSIMLYPSRAGGSGLGDQRAIVMVYEDNTLIPNRLAPSGQDIDRLLTLYGTSGSTPGEPHTSKSSKLRNAFKRVRSMNFRAGDTQAGLC